MEEEKLLLKVLIEGVKEKLRVKEKLLSEVLVRGIFDEKG